MNIPVDNFFFYFILFYFIYRHYKYLLLLIFPFYFILFFFSVFNIKNIQFFDSVWKNCILNSYETVGGKGGCKHQLIAASFYFTIFWCWVFDGHKGRYIVITACETTHCRHLIFEAISYASFRLLHLFLHWNAAPSAPIFVAWYFITIFHHPFMAFSINLLLNICGESFSLLLWFGGWLWKRLMLPFYCRYWHTLLFFNIVVYDIQINQELSSFHSISVILKTDVDKIMQLYHHPYSLDSQKVRLTLEENGIDYTSYRVNPITGKNMEPSFFRLNPSAKLPVFQNGSHIIFDTIDMMQYVSSFTNHFSMLILEDLRGVWKQFKIWIFMMAKEILKITGKWINKQIKMNALSTFNWYLPVFWSLLTYPSQTNLKGRRKTIPIFERDLLVVTEGIHPWIVFQIHPYWIWEKTLR